MLGLLSVGAGGLSTKVSFIVPARNKEAHVGKCVASVLGQNYSPMEMVFSVQPSEDDTLGAAKDAVAGYRGPNEVRVLECPEGDAVGMRGMNVHIGWIMERVTGDLVVMCSADDYNDSARVSETVRAFDAYHPSYIGTRVIYETPEGTQVAETGFIDRSSRFVSLCESIKHQIGSSGSSAWARDLWEKYGPLRGVEAQDMILPMMALMERGIYFIDKPLHHHVLHADPNNTGMEGQMRAYDGGGAEMLRLEELNAAHNTMHWTGILRRWCEHGHYPSRLNRDSYDALAEKIIGAATGWAMKREELTLARIEPKAMRA